MNNNIKIVTDSSVQLTPEEIAAYHVQVIPLNILIDGQNYIDGIDISKTEFMTKMAAADQLPTTSQPSIGSFLETFDELTADGSQVLAILMSETLSGTVNAARQAASMCEGTVTVVDSDFTDRASAFQVLLAAEEAKNGKDLATILNDLEAIKHKTSLYMSVSNLTNLVKGGRISKVSGMISNLLNIKVILQFKDAKLDAIGKGRGMKTINRFYDELIEKIKALPSVKMVGISHADDSEFANNLKQRIEAALPDVKVLLAPTSPIIATHTGPGALAVMYYCD